MANDVWTAPAGPVAGVASLAEMQEQRTDNLYVVELVMEGDQSASGKVHRHKTGTLAGIPAAGKPGRLYRTTDEGGLVLIDDGTLWVPDGVQVLDRDLVTESAISSVAWESIYSHSIPGNIMGVTGGVELTLGGEFVNNRGGDRTLEIRITLGATVALTSNASPVVTSANVREWKLGLLIMNSAVDAQRWSSLFSLSHSGAEDFTIFDPADYTSAMGVGYGTSAEDSTGALVLDVEARLSESHVSLSFRRHIALLKVIPAA